MITVNFKNIQYKNSIKVLFIIIFFQFSSINIYAQNIKLKAWIVDSDSFTRVSFAVVSIKGKTIATTTDERGFFEITCKITDTIQIRHLSYNLTTLAAKKIVDSTKSKYFIYLTKKEVTIQQIIISGKKLPDEKKEEFNIHLNRIRPTGASPISLMYEKWSRKGKERSKMDDIYSELLLRDELEARIPPQKLFLITNDRSVKLDDLLIICPLSADFVKKATDYDFFLHFYNCWKKFKSDN